MYFSMLLLKTGDDQNKKKPDEDDEKRRLLKTGSTVVRDVHLRTPLQHPCQNSTMQFHIFLAINVKSIHPSIYCTIFRRSTLTIYMHRHLMKKICDLPFATYKAMSARGEAVHTSHKHHRNKSSDKKRSIHSSIT